MTQLGVKEAAKVLKVHENTVRNLERDGKLKAYRDYRNYRVFNEADVLKLKIERDRLRAANE